MEEGRKMLHSTEVSSLLELLLAADNQPISCPFPKKNSVRTLAENILYVLLWALPFLSEKTEYQKVTVFPLPFSRA